MVSASFEKDIADRWAELPFQEGRPVSDAVLRRVPILIGSEAEWKKRYPEVCQEMEGSRVLGFATLPTISRGRPLGGLSFSFPGERGFDEEDGIFLATLAEQVAQGLERAQLFEAERRARIAARGSGWRSAASSRAGWAPASGWPAWRGRERLLAPPPAGGCRGGVSEGSRLNPNGAPSSGRRWWRAGQVCSWREVRPVP